MIISVLIARPLGEPFSYQCPPELLDGLEEGRLLLVPLGRQEVIGCVWSMDQELARQGLGKRAPRVISGVLEGLPALPKALIELIKQLARYYHCPLGEALRLALPHITTQKGHSLTAQGRELSAVAWERDLALPRELWEGFDALRTLLLSRPMRALDLPFALSKQEWQRLSEQRLIQPCRYPTISPPRVSFESLRAPQLTQARSGPARLMSEVHQRCATLGPLSIDRLRSHLEEAVTSTKLKKALRGLIDARALSPTVERSSAPRELHPDDLSTQAQSQQVMTAAAVTLTGEQRGAVDRILEGEGYEAFLLHGVTGSGKTEVYLEVIREVLSSGKDALVLVPEIGLTPQTIRRFEEQLEAPVYPWHSGLSPRQRLEVWCALGAREPKVLVGARSALFAPLSRLGVIIIDECHDSSYKQGEGVRYHARDMAVLRATLTPCPVILGSATPSLECIENANRGKYTLLQLTQRPCGATLPVVHLIDLRSARVVSEQAPAFSHQLAQAIALRLERGEQSILYLNRRGFSQSVRCVQCGFQFKCRSCEITLPWHERSQKLECHHCDFKASLPHRCPECDVSGSFLPIGRGTERIEQQVSALFPKARLRRLDRDSELSPLELERLMRGHEVDILIGTQMVTKGHDFPLVTLVGVLDADGALDLPDFRASERCYQLISQVSGRAGRAVRPGEVLIQTYRPHDELLQAARHHDFGRFAAYERTLRGAVGYPPFCYMIALRVEGIAGEVLDFALTILSNTFSTLPMSVKRVGPTLAPINQLRGKRRWIMILRGADRRVLHQQVELGRASLAQQRWPSSIRLTIDVDPVDFL